MGTAKSGDNELIRVTVVDYFTGTPLVDRLVWPDVAMQHLNTQWSGVTWSALHGARLSKTCLFGRDNARKAVWKFVGPETVVVGHSANNDLKSLRWIHPNVVDSFVIEWTLQKPMRDAKQQAAKEKAEREKAAKAQAEAATILTYGKPILQPAPAVATPGDQAKPKPQKKPRKLKGSGDLSLKTLARTKLGREIQNAGKAGHDSLEDAIAARDLVHWHISNPPRDISLGDAM